jgi:Sec-independent protein translocase protein TatA
MPRPFLAALWIIARIVVIVVLIWGAYALAQIYKNTGAASETVATCSSVLFSI